MHNDIPLKYYDIADEYATEASEQVAGSVRVALMMLRTSSISGEMNSLPQKPLW